MKELFSKAEDEKTRRRLDAPPTYNDDGGDGGDEGSGPGPAPPPPIFNPTFPTQQQRPVLPPRSPRSLPQQATLDDLFNEEGGFFGTVSLDDVRTNFWNNNDTKFQISFKNPLTSLADKSNNVIEMVQKVKEKTEPEEIAFSEKLNRIS